MNTKLEQFKNYLEEMEKYTRAASLLYWDMRTIMPKDGFEGHSEAAAFFSTKAFEMSTSKELEDMLEALSSKEEYDKLDDTWKYIVRIMKRDIDLDKRIPADFYAKFVKAQNESERAWEEAKNANDFSIFAPHLAEVIELTKQMQAYRQPEKEVYDALLDQFEEGMDSKTIDRIFKELKAGLLPLVKKILAAKQPDDSIFKGYYDVHAQEEVQALLLKYIGFDFDKGTVGQTEHPFTMNFSSKDVRVTNHYYDNEAINAMFSAIHEGGHAVFEQNVNPAYDNTVAGSCRYMGIHESQSRFYENILGRNKNFWIPVYDKISELLPKFKEISLDDFAREINHVRNSFIRTDADEVTYCLHIIIRYEIEKEIFRNNVSVDKLPELWNSKMKEYLDIVPSNDAEGILQDMHWSDGSFGYFPTYLLGSIYDGMYLDKITEDLGNVDEILANGDILKITKWLNENIHQYGSTRVPKEVIEKVCHKEISAEPLLRYFTEKYTKVYDL